MAEAVEGFDAAADNAGREVTIREAAVSLRWSESKVRRALRGGQFRYERRAERGSQVYRIRWDSLPSGADWAAVDRLRRGEALRGMRPDEVSSGLEAVALKERLAALESLWDRERQEKASALLDLGRAQEQAERAKLLEARAASLTEEKVRAESDRDRLATEAATLRRSVRVAWLTAAILGAAAAIGIALRFLGR
jgi:hypothetical protein